MKIRNHRKFIRYDALHLLDYQVLDEEGKTGDYSMGRTIDVSIDGIKLETISAFKSGTHLLITVGIEDDLINLEGQITHIAPHDGRFLSGINFLKITKDGRRILGKYVEAFRQRKKGLTGQEETPRQSP
jgi:PilZ domain